MAKENVINAWRDAIKAFDEEVLHGDDMEEDENDLPVIDLTDVDFMDTLSQKIELQTRVEILHDIYNQYRNRKDKYQRTVPMETIGLIFGWDLRGTENEN